MDRTAGGDRWSSTWVQAFVCGAAALVTVAIAAAPSGLARGSTDPDLRLLIEVSCLFLALTAALVLSLTERADLGPTRDAFIAALLVLAVTNAVFAVIPVFSDVRLPVDRGLAFWPWVVSRFVAGALLVAAASGWPRIGLARTSAAAFAAVVALNALAVAVGDRLPAVVAQTPDGTVQVLSTGWLAVLMLVPAVLFAAGAWLAARLARRGAAPLYGWLSVALILQVFAQFHALAAPAFLGPTVSTMDLFRSLSWLSLAGGAVAQLRHLYLARSRTAALQAQDLSFQAGLLAEQRRLHEREQDFRAVVSHELATPVAAIRAFGHVLSSPAAGTEQRTDALAGLTAEAGRLAELVDRIDELRDLDVAEVSCDLRPVSIGPLLTEARAFAVGLPGRNDVILRRDDDRVLADPVRLGQLLRNVLANAVRYSPPGAPIELRGRRTSSDTYRVEVLDRGPGIAPEDRERLLEPYARGTDASGTGSGLGLYVARRLAEVHGGELSLHAGHDGHGTRVMVTLRRST